PAADVLEQRRDKVKLSVHDGHCTVQSREMEPTVLARAEAVDAIEHDAPVGIPEPIKKPSKKKTAPVQQNVPPPAKTVDPKAAKLEKQRLLEEQKKLTSQQKVAPSKNGKPVQQPYDVNQANVGSGSRVTKGTQQAPQQAAQQAPQPQIVPEPKASVPQVNEDDKARQKK
ncbi:MAG TPA: hypothetical protein VFV99_24615, partial [Kofleriaceae bacterium]|nr:hypothetical protein [Kofleriaceae bacterium]